ncbi:hypothetical protein QBC47DRAFT_307724 [Echria macrotheca]|uniref:DUF7719 domain-containing protein n=1 Tax=Echria macrotheca TaxID=438768 RepID=A0AAJ0B4V9_9PEZI|nr:hypothetical protein QBC47DRAFT_307724 [Echria macrotheca]
MARKRKESPSRLKLKQPNRSGPSEETLIELAEKRGLFAQAKQKEDANKKASPAAKRVVEDPEDEEMGLSPTAERILETILWTVSLAMLHFTLDVLVQNQYAMDRVQWPKVTARAFQALMVFGLLFYVLHPHASNPTILPGLPLRFQSGLRKAIFFATSVGAGCYLVHVTNSFGYLAVMKQAPPLGCLWVWSVIELDLIWAIASLAGTGMFTWWGGYSLK